MASKQYPSVEYVRQALGYRDGRVFWRVRPRDHFATRSAWLRVNRQYAGKEAGHLSKSGERHASGQGEFRWCVRLGGKHIRRSHVSWAIVKGSWPRDELDHKNQDILDDRAEDLRECTRSQNMANAVFGNNGSGRKGVHRRPSGKYYASICVNRQQIHLGSYDTAEEASAAYEEAARKHFGEFARTSRSNR